MGVSPETGKKTPQALESRWSSRKQANKKPRIVSKTLGSQQCFRPVRTEGGGSQQSKGLSSGIMYVDMSMHAYTYIEKLK